MKMKNQQIEFLKKLRDVINESTREMSICVPNTDFYSRGSEWSKEYISFVDGEKLYDNIGKLITELLADED